MRLGAVLGAAALSTLAIAPAAFADHGSSQATAQSIDLSIAGNDVVVQEIQATSDGSGSTSNDVSTMPPLAGVIPGNAEAFVGVAPQQAVANPDGTSYACAGVAGTGGGLVTVGESECNISAGQPLNLSLGSLDLDLANLLGGQGALTDALEEPLAPLLGPLGEQLDSIVAQISAGLAGTPLGAIEIGGTLSAIQGTCAANPETATGDATLVSVGGGDVPIGVTIPGELHPSGQDTTVPLLNLPANPDPNTHVVTDLDEVVNVLLDGIETQLTTTLTQTLAGVTVTEPATGATVPLNTVLGTVVGQIQTALVDTVITQVADALAPIEENILDITLNKQEPVSPAQDRIEVTALDIQVLPAAAEVAGFSLISGMIGHVTCGDNARLAHGDPQPAPAPEPGAGPAPASPAGGIPTQVDSGLGSNTTAILVGTGALMLVAGLTGVAGYRRMLQQ